MENINRNWDNSLVTQAHIFDDPKYLRRLISLGLTEREGKIYLALLTRGFMTAIELQEKVDIPRTKIYEILQRMINRGLCIEKRIGRNKLYEPVDPKIAFQSLLEVFKNELKRKEEVAEELIDVCTSCFNASKEIGNPLDFIEILKDKIQIHRKYVSVVESTRYELLTFNKGPYACDNPHRLKEQQIAETEFMKRGGICKNIYETFEIEKYLWLVEYIKEQQLDGQQAKLVDFLPIKMVISDGERVMLPLEGRSGESIDLVMCYINHKAFGNACKMLFDHLWEKAREMEIFLGAGR